MIYSNAMFNVCYRQEITSAPGYSVRAGSCDTDSIGSSSDLLGACAPGENLGGGGDPEAAHHSGVGAAGVYQGQNTLGLVCCVDTVLCTCTRISS